MLAALFGWRCCYFCALPPFRMPYHGAERVRAAAEVGRVAAPPPQRYDCLFSAPQFFHDACRLFTPALPLPPRVIQVAEMPLSCLRCRVIIFPRVIVDVPAFFFFFFFRYHDAETVDAIFCRCREVRFCFKTF